MEIGSKLGNHILSLYSSRFLHVLFVFLNSDSLKFNLEVNLIQRTTYLIGLTAGVTGR